jgi:hypothetical protein
MKDEYLYYLPKRPDQEEFVKLLTAYKDAGQPVVLFVEPHFRKGTEAAKPVLDSFIYSFQQAGYTAVLIVPAEKKDAVEGRLAVLAAIIQAPAS